MTFVDPNSVQVPADGQVAETAWGTTVNDDLNALHTAVGNLQGQLTAMQGSGWSSGGPSLESLNNLITTLSNQQSTDKNDISTLQTQYSTLQAQLNNLAVPGFKMGEADTLGQIAVGGSDNFGIVSYTSGITGTMYAIGGLTANWSGTSGNEEVRAYLQIATANGNQVGSASTGSGFAVVHTDGTQTENSTMTMAMASQAQVDAGTGYELSLNVFSVAGVAPANFSNGWIILVVSA